MRPISAWIHEQLGWTSSCDETKGRSVGVLSDFLLPLTGAVCSDKISSTNPRVIEDQRARQLCIDVRHSLFYETCATYGFNVDRVFSEGERTCSVPDITFKYRGDMNLSN